MIDLTPLEVRQKKGDFRRAFRGYDAELVNDFMDLVADRMEELVQENLALTDRVTALEEELEDYKGKEAALSDALMAAQKLREDARKHAEKESELMIREARADAEEARQRAAKSLAREEETLRQVRARRASLVESFRHLLEREINELDVIEEALELRADAEKAEDRRVAGRRPEARPASPERTPGPLSPDAGQQAPEPEPEPGAAVGGDEEPEPRAAVGGDEAPEPAGGDGSEPQTEEGDASQEEDASDNDPQEDWLRSLVEE
ncbi:MAG: DivIVA domain-containing protein [Candidatus Longimicrobiales bacterium M2_2A_002]